VSWHQKLTKERKWGSLTKEARSQRCGVLWAKVVQCTKGGKYAPENWINEGHPILEFPTIRDK
ncbi:hypothetical protein HAX54_000582, partial [Datura stramonium]|nr:hypothetical protein [Datura stramonium]